jgi:hypothetical protein
MTPALGLDTACALNEGIPVLRAMLPQVLEVTVNHRTEITVTHLRLAATSINTPKAEPIRETVQDLDYLGWSRTIQ